MAAAHDPAAQDPSKADGNPANNSAIIEDQPDPTPEIGDRIMVIKEAWLALILSGTKTMEIRSRPAATGHTWIAYDGLVYASAEISRCVELSEEDFEGTRGQHWHIGKAPPYETLYGLLLENVVKLRSPVPHYRKPAHCKWTCYKTQQEDRKPRKKNPERKRKHQQKVDPRDGKKPEDTEELQPLEDQPAEGESKPPASSIRTALPQALPKK